MKLQVYGTIQEKVEINPVDVLKQIHIIDSDNWIHEENTVDGIKYIEYREIYGGHRSFETKVREVSKEVYDLYMAKIMLINYLEKQ